MPDSQQVTLVKWNPKDKPPKGDRNRNVLIAVNRENGGQVLSRMAWNLKDYASAYDMWGEYPIPPEDDTLTVEDLEALAHPASHTSWQYHMAQERLRRALEALGKSEVSH